MDERIRDLKRKYEKYPVVEAVKRMSEERAGTSREHEEPLTTISQVPEIIRQVDRGHYEPRMICIGPYYRFDKWDHLKNFDHDHKLRLLNRFLCRNRNLCVEEYMEALESLGLDARQCYGESIQKVFDGRLHIWWGPHYFVELLLLDGCFILELFFMWLDEDPDVLFNERRGQTTIFCDLLLFDNQIPFVVIEKLYELVMTGQAGTSRDTFLSLLAKFLMNEEPSHASLVEWPTKPIHHLLDLYHQFLIATTCLSQDQKNYNPIALPLWKQRLTNDMITPRLDQRDANRPPRQISCATELYEAGIKFRKKKSPKNLLDVTFSKGILEIPLLQIDENKVALLIHLLTLERYKTREEQIVTSYFVLMDTLINTEGDVALLQRVGIIHNMLSSHHEASIFFNEVGGGLSFDIENHLFAKLFREVQPYYESNWNRSWARLMHDYFNSPWAIVSVTAGVILLVLSFLQTMYTVYPYWHKS